LAAGPQHIAERLCLSGKDLSIKVEATLRRRSREMIGCGRR
jgi:hypothetical protein